MELHTTRVQDKQISISRFGAIEGWRLVHKISSIVGPSVGALAKEDYQDAVSLIFSKCDEDQLINLLQQLTSVVLIDGKRYDRLGEYMFTIEVCKAVLEYNFNDFFSPIKEVLAGLFQEKLKG